MNSAILVAAGKGVRMGAAQNGTDKLFLEIAGRPLVAHTWQRFEDARCIDEIVLVVRRAPNRHARIALQHGVVLKQRMQLRRNPRRGDGSP